MIGGHYYRVTEWDKDRPGLAIAAQRPAQSQRGIVVHVVHHGSVHEYEHRVPWSDGEGE